VTIRAKLIAAIMPAVSGPVVTIGLAGVVALAIVATLLLQAAPAPWLAHRLGPLEPAPTAPG